MKQAQPNWPIRRLAWFTDQKLPATVKNLPTFLARLEVIEVSHFIIAGTVQ